MSVTPPNNPKVVKVTMVYDCDTRIFNNVMHFERNATWTAADMRTLCDNIKTWWATLYSAACSSTVILVQIQARLLDPTNPLAVDFNVTPTIPGQASGAPAPANVSLTISLRAGKAGRKYRGRIYVPRFSAASLLVTDQVNSATAGILANVATGMFTIGAGTSSALTIFHRSGSTFDDVNTIVIDTTLDAQRRRLPGRGR
jgi:hypothetical protein